MNIDIHTALRLEALDLASRDAGTYGISPVDLAKMYYEFLSEPEDHHLSLPAERGELLDIITEAIFNKVDEFEDPELLARRIGREIQAAPRKEVGDD
ncbi:hypothetical protein QP735_04275 [Curtobacterium citreum]|uniref:hypothetical protein n=1 Tax=Curtobacterium citreum TaxID=2036 RepID=UPI00254BE3F7|nr:hypothetical protein [Curtobacterium citreum]MDK8171740.1 hypothetical protein [Curtobacterium citreum]